MAPRDDIDYDDAWMSPMIKNFVYVLPPTRVLFGNGAIAELPNEAARAKISRVLILCSKRRNNLAVKLSETLGDRCAGICDAAVPNMPREAFDFFKDRLANSRADGFVAVGGGSAMGLAKSVAAATQLPFMAVVTTLSGSEMSPKWALGRGDGRGAGSDVRALPTAAIYDPDLTLGLPPLVIAASGMNALAHAVETLYGDDTNPVIQTLAEKSISILAQNLPEVVADPGHRGARSQALYGAWLAAAFRSNTCLHHVIAQQVRQLFDLDHAQTHAVVLPYALAFNAPAIPAAMKALRRSLGTAEPARAIYELNVRMGLPTSLADIGMPAALLAEAIDVIMKPKGYNPRPFTREDVAAILKQALAGGPPAAVDLPT